MSNFHIETENNRSLSSSNGEVDWVRCHTCDHVKERHISIYFPPINSDTNELFNNSFFTVFSFSLSHSFFLLLFFLRSRIATNQMQNRIFFRQVFYSWGEKKNCSFSDNSIIWNVPIEEAGYSCVKINFDYRASGTIVLLFVYAYLLVIMLIAYKSGFVVQSLVCGLSRQVSGLFR